MSCYLDRARESCYLDRARVSSYIDRARVVVIYIELGRVVI